MSILVASQVSGERGSFLRFAAPQIRFVIRSLDRGTESGHAGLGNLH